MKFARSLALLAFLLLGAGPAHAQGIGGGIFGPAIPKGATANDILVWNAITTRYGVCTLSGDFIKSGACSLDLDSLISHFGSCTGNVSTELCPDTLFGTNSVDMSNVPRLYFPDEVTDSCQDDTECPIGFSCEGGSCDTEAGNDGQLCGEGSDCTGGSCTGACTCDGAVCKPTTATATRWDTSLDLLEAGIGTSSGSYVYGQHVPLIPGRPERTIGGNERTLNFVYHGENSCPGGATTRDICRWGTCSGSAAPNGTCTIDAASFNSSLMTQITSTGGDQDATPTNHKAAILLADSFSVTAGTITASSTNIDKAGLAVIFRVRNNAIINEQDGTVVFSFSGLGGSAASGSCACQASTAGKNGVGTFNGLFGAGGAGTGTGGVAGSNGGPAYLTNLWPFVATPFPLIVGGGGGALPCSGQTAPGLIDNVNGRPVFGGGGGGGGGCGSACVGGTISAGGRGGAALGFEIGGRYDCTGADFNMSGANGGASRGGGGGAGGVTVLAGDVVDGSPTCTYTNTGGTAGGTAVTGCSASGNGGNGANIIVEVP